MAEPRPISSRDNPLLQRIRKLAADPSGYRKLGEVWIEGEHLCAAFAQRGGRALQAVLTRDGWHDPTLRVLADGAAASVIVTPELMA
ncbi:MAG TPA: RNA methyltransferase, partial [Burkholderiaceae bacterium]|nr:RNA methyltransferase [Burkholderiaceae bacterium]